MVKTVYDIENIHTIYLSWMNEPNSYGLRKDRFIAMMKNIPIEKQYEIEQWIVSALAIGLENGYNDATTHSK